MKLKKKLTCIVFITLHYTLCIAGESDDFYYPINLSLEISDNPMTKQAVRWITLPEKLNALAQIVEDDPTPDLEQKCKNVPVESNIISLYDTVFAYHRVEFQYLKQNTKYLYRVGDGNGKWTEWIQFKTASFVKDSFSFLYFGDIQNGILTHYPRVIRQATMTGADASFLLFTGDISNRGYISEFEDFFNASGWILREKPIVAIPGNHEFRYIGNLEDDENRELTKEWNYIFGKPDNVPHILKNSACFYYDYQGVRFVLINSRDLEDGADSLVTAQFAWLEKALIAPNCRFLIVAQHYPVYPMGDGRLKKKIENKLDSLFKLRNVDLVLTGHDHVYSRIASTTKKFEKNVAPAYVLSMSGEKMYVSNYQWKVDRMGTNRQMFQKISIVDNKLIFRGFDATGELYDSFMIEKKNGMKKITDLKPNVPESIDLPPGRKFRYDDEQWKILNQRKQNYLLNKIELNK